MPSQPPMPAEWLCIFTRQTPCSCLCPGPRASCIHCSPTNLAWLPGESALPTTIIFALQADFATALIGADDGLLAQLDHHLLQVGRVWQGLGAVLMLLLRGHTAQFSAELVSAAPQPSAVQLTTSSTSVPSCLVQVADQARHLSERRRAQMSVVMSCLLETLGPRATATGGPALKLVDTAVLVRLPWGVD